MPMAPWLLLCHQVLLIPALNYSNQFMMTSLLSKVCARLGCCPPEPQLTQDAYNWLNNPKPSPKDQLQLKSESDYAHSVLSGLSHECQRLQDSMAARVPEFEVSAPWWGPGLDDPAGYWYQRRRGPRDSSWRLFRWSARTMSPHDTDEQTVFDENQGAQQHTYYDVGMIKVSPDGRYVAYSADTQGNEMYCIRVRKLGQGRYPSEDGDVLVADGCGPHLAWTLDSQHVVATHCTQDTGEVSKLVRHAVDGSGQHAMIMGRQSEQHSRLHADTPKGEQSRAHVTMSWMGEVSRGRYLAVLASWDGGCEVRLISLDDEQEEAEDAAHTPHTHPAASELAEGPSDGTDTAASGRYLVALSWQDEWDVHKVDLVGDVLVMLVDSDEWPDGQVIAVPVPELSPPGSGLSMTTQSGQQSAAGTGARGLLAAQHQPGLHAVLVPGGAEVELRQFEVVGRQLVVARTQRLISHIDLYHLPMCGKPGKGSTRGTFIQCAWSQLSPAWSWSPCNTYASVCLQTVLAPPTALDASGDVMAPPGLKVHVVYSQLTVPETTVELDLDAHTSKVVHVEEVAGTPPVTASHYKSDLVYAPSTGGVQVPVSVAYRVDLMRRDGSNPCFLHAYGAYGSKQQPSFNPMDLPLLDKGVLVAIAHVRGGGELGAAWHRQGKLHLKHHTFDDVEAVARHLVGLGMTSHSRMAFWGRSAGGLAVAATIARTPQVCRAAVLDVPFLDVLTAMSDPGLPLTLKERREWGDPLNSKEEHDVIASYSPYHTLEAALLKQLGSSTEQQQGGAGGASWVWPDLLITASLQDERVPYWGPAKYVARLRSLIASHSSHSTVTSPVVCFMTDTSSGHFGSSSAQGRLKDRADKAAFLLAALQAAE